MNEQLHHICRVSQMPLANNKMQCFPLPSESKKARVDNDAQDAAFTKHLKLIGGRLSEKQEQRVLALAEKEDSGVELSDKEYFEALTYKLMEETTVTDDELDDLPGNLVALIKEFRKNPSDQNSEAISRYFISDETELSRDDGGGTRGNSPRYSRAPSIDLAQLRKEKAMSQQPAYWRNLEDDLDRVLRDGLRPLYEFVGIMAVRMGDRSDVRVYYKWKEQGATLEKLQSPVVCGATNYKEFVQKNAFLGRDVLEVFLKNGAVEKKDEDEWQPISANPLGDEESRFIEEILDTMFSERKVRYANEWVYGAIDKAVFAHLLNATCLGAMEMAAAQVRRMHPHTAAFELKELVFSPGVRDMFAIFCAYQYLGSSGGNAYMGRQYVGQQGQARGTTYNLSAGLKTRQLLSDQIYTARFWFERVYRVPNPRLKELDEEIANAGNDVQQKSALQRIRPKMLTHVLVHYE